MSDIKYCFLFFFVVVFCCLLFFFQKNVLLFFCKLSAKETFLKKKKKIRKQAFKLDIGRFCPESAQVSVTLSSGNASGLGARRKKKCKNYFTIIK